MSDTPDTPISPIRLTHLIHLISYLIPDTLIKIHGGQRKYMVGSRIGKEAGSPHTWWLGPPPKLAKMWAPRHPSYVASPPCICLAHHVFSSKYQVSGIRYQVTTLTQTGCIPFVRISGVDTAIKEFKVIGWGGSTRANIKKQLDQSS